MPRCAVKAGARSESGLLGGSAGRAGQEPGRGTAHEIREAPEQQDRLVPCRAAHLADRREHARAALLQLERPVAAAHLQGEVRCHRVRFPDAELVVGSGRTSLGAELMDDARELQTPLAPPECGTGTVADEHHSLGIPFHLVPHGSLPESMSAYRPLYLTGPRACNRKTSSSPPERP